MDTSAVDLLIGFLAGAMTVAMTFAIYYITKDDD
jgi:hypothetical protein